MRTRATRSPSVTPAAIRRVMMVVVVVVMLVVSSMGRGLLALLCLGFELLHRVVVSCLHCTNRVQRSDVRSELASRAAAPYPRKVNRRTPQMLDTSTGP
jgi:hypothetical protein